MKWWFLFKACFTLRTHESALISYLHITDLLNYSFFCLSGVLLWCIFRQDNAGCNTCFRFFRNLRDNRRRWVLDWWLFCFLTHWVHTYDGLSFDDNIIKQILAWSFLLRWGFINDLSKGCSSVFRFLFYDWSRGLALLNTSILNFLMLLFLLFVVLISLVIGKLKNWKVRLVLKINDFPYNLVIVVIDLLAILVAHIIQTVVRNVLEGY